MCACVCVRFYFHYFSVAFNRHSIKWYAKKFHCNGFHFNTNCAVPVEQLKLWSNSLTRNAPNHQPNSIATDAKNDTLHECHTTHINFIFYFSAPERSRQYNICMCAVVLAYALRIYECIDTWNMIGKSISKFGCFDRWGRLVLGWVSEKLIFILWRDVLCFEWIVSATRKTETTRNIDATPTRKKKKTQIITLTMLLVDSRSM